MPRAKAKSSSGLSIELSDDRKFYSPGDRISGNVVLNTAQDFAIGSVNIWFYGRVKVYYVYSHGQGESHHRGRAPLFSSTLMLYQGYHTHKPGTFSWPFVFDIPTTPDIATLHAAKHQWKEKEHFIATDDYVPSHSIPPSFNMWKHGFGYRWHAFVEFVLDVDVKEAPGASMVLPASLRKATLPIMVRDIASSERNPMALPLAIQFTMPADLNEKSVSSSKVTETPRLKTHSSRHTIKSSKLDTWDRKRGTSSAQSFSSSFRDKTKSIFNSDSLPRYTFDFSISLPEEAQLLQEGAIPIKVNAIPVQGEEYTTIQPDNYPDVRIDNISLDIVAYTYLRFKSVLSSNKSTKYDINLLNRHPVDCTIDVKKSSRLLADEADNTEPTYAGSIDISTLPGLSVSLTSAKMGRQTEMPLAQTFSTYIIARKYSINYKLELDVAGEKVRVANDEEIPLRILPPESRDLANFLGDSDAAKGNFEPEPDPEEGDDNSESEDNEIGEAPESKKEKGVLGKIRSRKSQAQEAGNEDAASSSMDAQLPAYQAQPTGFGFRNEIDEQPPRYEAK